jgi:hypothetical protein
VEKPEGLDHKRFLQMAKSQKSKSLSVPSLYGLSPNFRHTCRIKVNRTNLERTIEQTEKEECLL